MSKKKMSKAAKKRAKMIDCFKDLDKKSGAKKGHIIGFDFSLTSTGYCVIDLDGKVKDIGVSETSTKDGSVRERLDVHHAKFSELVAKYNPIIINYEMVVVARHLDSFKKLIMTQAQLYRAISELGANDPFIAPVGIGTIKRAVTGDYKADKNVMVKETFKKWGVDTDHDDAADAHGAARVGLECLKLKDKFLDLLDKADDEHKMLLDWDKGRLIDTDDQDLYDGVCTVMQSNMTIGDNDL